MNRQAPRGEGNGNVWRRALAVTVPISFGVGLLCLFPTLLLIGEDARASLRAALVYAVVLFVMALPVSWAFFRASTPRRHRG